MVVPLWILGWAVPNLTYRPIIGWQFEDAIDRRLEEPLDGEVEVHVPRTLA